MKNILKDRFITMVNTLLESDKALNKSAIAKKMGVTPQVISNHLNENRSTPAEFIDDFIEKFHLNREFYETGLGSPLTKFVNQVETVRQSNAFSIGEIQQTGEDSPFIDLGNGQYIMIVPLVQDYAYAGYLAGYQDNEYLEDLPKHSFVVNKKHKGIYMAFQVIGDSMSNGTDESIPEGSTVTGREIQKHLWNSRFHIHRFKDYIVVHKEGILIKRIIKHDVDSGVITCLSLNPDKETYPDFELSLNDCSQIFNIVNITQVR